MWRMLFAALIISVFLVPAIAVAGSGCCGKDSLYAPSDYTYQDTLIARSGIYVPCNSDITYRCGFHRGDLTRYNLHIHINGSNVHRDFNAYDYPHNGTYTFNGTGTVTSSPNEMVFSKNTAVMNGDFDAIWCVANYPPGHPNGPQGP